MPSRTCPGHHKPDASAGGPTLGHADRWRSGRSRRRTAVPASCIRRTPHFRGDENRICSALWALAPGELVARHAMAPLAEAVKDFRVVIVNGARQSGKTTLLRQLQRSVGGVRVSLDDAAVLSAAKADPVGFVDRDDRMLIDEVQLGGDALIRAIKAAVDRDPRPGRFVLAGSSRFLTVPGLSESLAGRAHIIDLWTLSQGELGATTGRFIDDLFTGRPLRAPAVDATPSRTGYLARACAGGFPEVLRRSTARARSSWLAGYVRTVVQRDVAEVSHARHLDEMPRLLRYLAAMTAQELNAARLAEQIQLADDTVRRYLPILETVYLVHRVPAWSRNLTAKVKKHPKIYLTDSGLAAHLLGTSADALAVSESPQGRRRAVAGQVNPVMRSEPPGARPLSQGAPAGRLSDSLGQEIATEARRQGGPFRRDGPA